jgi:hypothetical protein
VSPSAANRFGIISLKNSTPGPVTSLSFKWTVK